MRQTTRDKIDRAAQPFLLRNGIRGWNMDDFASEAGVTKRTLYQYVASKEDLVEKTLLAYIRNTQTALALRLQDAPDFRTGLETILAVYPDMIVMFDSFAMQSIFRQYPAIEERLIAQRSSLTADIGAFLRQGQLQGDINADADADVIIQIVQALILYYAKSDPAHLGDKLRQSFQTVMHGFMAKGM
jgi:AcrR family transcriptional regulator